MTHFETNPVWGGCQVTARDQARFFYRLRSLLPRAHRSYALGLLARIVAHPALGNPARDPPGWRIHFKGGWYPGRRRLAGAPGGTAAPGRPAAVGRGAEQRRA